MNIIETNQLYFKYKHDDILKDINLKVEQGSIYGYLGKNGAGKTTTLKILLGLLQNYKGHVLFYGKDFYSNRINNLHKIGNLIERPSLYEHLTVYQQLQYFDVLFRKGENRIEEILDLTGLKKEKAKKIKYLSTGMKQRLSVGLSLFHDPDLLILDEPVNGLDPEGVYNIRRLLLQMQERGKTIILSSHILSEIEKICSHVGILDKGQLIYQGAIKDLLLSTQKKVVLHCSDTAKAICILNEHNLTCTKQNNDSLCFYVQNGCVFNKILTSLINEVEIFNIETINESLEDIFINITSNEK